MRAKLDNVSIRFKVYFGSITVANFVKSTRGFRLAHPQRVCPIVARLFCSRRIRHQKSGIKGSLRLVSGPRRTCKWLSYTGQSTLGCTVRLKSVNLGLPREKFQTTLGEHGPNRPARIPRMPNDGIGTRCYQFVLSPLSILNQVGKPGPAPEHAQLSQEVTRHRQRNPKVHDSVAVKVEKVVL